MIYSIKNIFFLTLIFVFTLTSCRKQDIIDSQDVDKLPDFGFNARGNIEPLEQTLFADNYFNKIITVRKLKLVVRVTGGTQSQITFPGDWTDETIANWVKLQKIHGLRFVFVVNGNDSPASQRNFLQRWLTAGAQFDFIEMMNEYYLKKYALGDLSNAEVTEKISPQKYTDTILPRYFTELDALNLPYYIILAPVADGNMQSYYMAWNDSVINAINNKYSQKNLNATLHLYLRGAGSYFDYQQIANIKYRLPATSHLAITEAGIIDSTLSYQQTGAASIGHYQKILPFLQPGDYMLDQVLYNNFQNNNTANLNPQYNGITPKGSAILSFINNGLK